MGGAMVGLADDPTAIYWNPAGLAGQNSSIYLCGTDVIPYGSYKIEAYNLEAKTKTNNYPSPNLFANYSMGNLAFGLGVFVPAGLGAEYNGDDLALLTHDTSLKWKSKIGVIDIAPSIAYKINNMFSFGLAGNIFYGMFDMDKPYKVNDSTFVQYTESSTGIGYGATLGALCKLSDAFQFGLSVRTKVNVEMSGEAENDAFAGTPVSTKSDFDREVAWPLWAAFGIAVKPMENLTITADAQYSQWEKSEDTFVTKFKNEQWIAYGAGSDTTYLEWKNCTQIRVGLEYKASDKLKLRAGYYYDPAPAPDKTLTILFPSSTNNVITSGFTYYINKINVDFGIEYLFGKERDVTVQTLHNNSGKHKLDVFAFSIACGIPLN